MDLHQRLPILAPQPKLPVVLVVGGLMNTRTQLCGRVARPVKCARGMALKTTFGFEGVVRRARKIALWSSRRRLKKWQDKMTGTNIVLYASDVRDLFIEPYHD